MLFCILLIWYFSTVIKKIGVNWFYGWNTFMIVFFHELTTVHPF